MKTMINYPMKKSVCDQLKHWIPLHSEFSMLSLKHASALMLNAFDAYLQHKLLDYQTQNIHIMQSYPGPKYGIEDIMCGTWDRCQGWVETENHHVTFPRYDCISPWLVGEDGSWVGNDDPLSSDWGCIWMLTSSIDSSLSPGCCWLVLAAISPHMKRTSESFSNFCPHSTLT